MTICIAVLAGHSRSMQLDSDYSADAVAIVTSGTAKGAKRASGNNSPPGEAAAAVAAEVRGAASLPAFQRACPHYAANLFAV